MDRERPLRVVGRVGARHAGGRRPGPPRRTEPASRLARRAVGRPSSRSGRNRPGRHHCAVGGHGRPFRHPAGGAHRPRRPGLRVGGAGRIRPPVPAPCPGSPASTGWSSPAGHHLRAPPAGGDPLADRPVVDGPSGWCSATPSTIGTPASVWYSAWSPGPMTWPPSMTSSATWSRRSWRPEHVLAWSHWVIGCPRIELRKDLLWLNPHGGLDASGKLRKQQSLRPKAPIPKVERAGLPRSLRGVGRPRSGWGNQRTW